MSLRPFLVASSAEVLNICEANKVTHSWFKVKNTCVKCALLIRDPSHLCLPLMSSCDKMDQAFPLCFCILQAIKNWMGGMPGNKANVTPHGGSLPNVCYIKI